MKRIGRILFHAFAAISLIFALTAAGLWVRSRFVHDRLTYSGDWTLVQIVSFNGKFGCEMPVELYRREALGVYLHSFAARHNALMRREDAFQFRRRVTMGSDGTLREVLFIALPNWCLMITFSLAPILWWRQARTRRHLPGHCHACGYDMRANPAKCSECGHEPASV